MGDFHSCALNSGWWCISFFFDQFIQMVFLNGLNIYLILTFDTTSGISFLGVLDW